MRGIKSVIYALLFVVKLRTLRFQLTRKKDLIREWAQLEQTNILNIRTVFNFVQDSHIFKEQRLILLAGVEEIRVQSQYIVGELKSYRKDKQKLVFGKNICDICSSYSAYYQCLRTFMQKKSILKQITRDMSIISLQISNPVVLQQYFQRLVFRSYQVALIVKTYGKYLSGSHSDKVYFVRALEIITNLNKKYDMVIRQGQKQREVVRLEKILGRKIAQELIYSRRCCSQQGEICLHVFESMLVLQGEGRSREVQLDMFTSVFIREVYTNQLVCVVTSNEVCYFLWPHETDLWRFVLTVRKVVACLSVSKSVFGYELKIEAVPFVLARVIDYREQQNLKGSKEEVFVVNVSCLKQSLPTDISTSISRLSSSMKETPPQLSRENEQNQPKELNQIVVFTSSQLKRFQCQTEQNYCLQIQSSQMTFGDRLSGKVLRMLQWQSYLNRLLRIKNVISNPIWLLKQFQVTQVLYESVVAAQVEMSQFQHCHLCSSVCFTTMNEFLQCRWTALVGKYTTERHRYCSNIFGRLKGEMYNIPLCFLKNVEELYIWFCFRQGKIDYVFHKRIISEKRYMVKVIIPSVQRTVCQVQITQYTLVGEVLDEIAFLIGLPVLLGYRLMLCFQGEQMFLNTNERILPIVTQYNVDYSKPEGKSFFKRLKSIGSYLQLFQAGVLILRKVVFCGQTVIGNAMSRTWELQNLISQFRRGKLVGLSRQTVLQMMILFFLLHRYAGKQLIPKSIKESHLQKYVPPTIDAESEQSYLALHRIYEQFKTKSVQELQKLMKFRAKISPFYEKYIVEMEVVGISKSLSTKRRIDAVLVGFGWNGVSIFTLHHHLVLEVGWGDIVVRLLKRGLLIEKRDDSIVLMGRQLYELKDLCGLYKSLKSLLKLINR